MKGIPNAAARRQISERAEALLRLSKAGDRIEHQHHTLARMTNPTARHELAGRMARLNGLARGDNAASVMDALPAGDVRRFVPIAFWF